MSSPRRARGRSATTHGEALESGRWRRESTRPDRSRHRCPATDASQQMTAAPKRLTADDVMTAGEVAGLLHAPVSTVEDWGVEASSQC